MNYKNIFVIVLCSFSYVLQGCDEWATLNRPVGPSVSAGVMQGTEMPQINVPTRLLPSASLSEDKAIGIQQMRKRFSRAELAKMKTFSEVECYEICWKRAWKLWKEICYSDSFSLQDAERVCSICIDGELSLSHQPNSGLEALWKLNTKQIEREDSIFLTLTGQLVRDPAKFFDPNYGLQQKKKDDKKRVVPNPLVAPGRSDNFDDSVVAQEGSQTDNHSQESGSKPVKKGCCCIC